VPASYVELAVVAVVQFSLALVDAWARLSRAQLDSVC
jgi:hypothetical protein